MKCILRKLIIFTCVYAAMHAATVNAADTWPTRPVKIVVAIAAGSAGDTLARIVARKLESVWGMPVIVENRPGAGGTVGTEYVVRSSDEHTILCATQTSILPKYVDPTLRFDPLTDLIPLYKLIRYQTILATNSTTKGKVGNLQGLIDFSKKSPGGVFFAGTGPTAMYNLSFALMNQEGLGMKYSEVNYNSVPAFTTSLIRDDAQVALIAPSSARQFLSRGDLVALAAINDERYPNLPTVPTIREAAGYQGYIPQVWAGFFAPKTMPAAALARIEHDLKDLANDPKVANEIETALSGSVIKNSSRRAFSSELSDEASRWEKLLMQVKIVK